MTFAKSFPQTKISMFWSKFQYFCFGSWWRHQMETFSALLAICAGNSPVPSEIPAKGQWRGDSVFYLNLCLNKWLRKQSWCWWFETLSRQLWRNCNDAIINSTSVMGWSRWEGKSLFNEILTRRYDTICHRQPPLNWNNWTLPELLIAWFYLFFII